MKKIFTLLFLVSAIYTYAQTDALSYQAVIINENEDEIPGLDISGNYLADTEVQLQFTIVDQEGNFEYQEIQTTTTDRYGMVNLTIGMGEVTAESQGLFTEINWDGTPKQLLVDLAIEGGEFTQFTNEELLFVPYAYHRNVIATGTLDVDGASTLNNSLTVTNQSPTLLSGDLTVEGDGFFNTITVENLSDLQGDVQIGGNTTMDGSLDVLNSNTATFTGNVFADLNLTVGENLNVGNNISAGFDISAGNSITAANDVSVGDDLDVEGQSNLNGQVTIDAFLFGNDNQSSAYPLRVRGSEQGIDIEVNGASNNANNFLTFRDANEIKGSIEAQSFNDLQESFEYTWELELFFIDLAFITAEGLAAASQLDFAEVAVCAANNLTYGIHYQAQENYRVDTYGIYFKSGGADYAEYLERANHSEILRKGDIVGVVGGKISKETRGADHIMVVSTNPIVLGNMPESEKAEYYEKVAFLGQVPVRVVGDVEVGDYILPSGNQDGLGIGKSPEEMQLDDYGNILGVAWQESRSPAMNLINVAVGLNANDVGHQLKKQEARIDRLEAQMAALLGEAKGEDVSSPNVEETPKINRETYGALLTEEQFEKWLEDYGFVFEYYMDELKKEYDRREIDYTRYPEIKAWVDQPLEELRAMHRGEKMATLWKNFVERYPEQFGGQGK